MEAPITLRLLSPGRCFSALLATAVISVLVLLKPDGAQASAQALPPENPVNSYYVISSDTGTTAYDLGYLQAGIDNSKHYNSWVVIDFGGQTSDGQGTDLVGTSALRTYLWDREYADEFAYGYTQAHPNYYVTLSLGTNNSKAVSAGFGYDWGVTVQATINDASSHNYTHVIVQGADDIEDWGSDPTATPLYFAQWENGSGGATGYVGGTPANIVNFGSAGGCPAGFGQYNNSIPCNNGWTQQSIYNVSWGFTPNEGMPEIYYDGTCSPYTTSQIAQWDNIAFYGATYQTKMSFEGPLNQPGLACVLSPTASWNDFSNALNAFSQTATRLTYNSAIINQ